jgi:hypothetical protein
MLLGQGALCPQAHVNVQIYPHFTAQEPWQSPQGCDFAKSLKKQAKITFSTADPTAYYDHHL